MPATLGYTGVKDNMFTPNNELRDPRVARKLRIELRRERLVQAEVLDQIRKLRNVLNLSPSMDSLPLGSAASPQSHGDPFLRSYGERAADRCRKGTDKDGISVINSSLGTMRPPAFPDPAWTPPKTGARSRPTTPTVVSSLRPRVQLYKDAVEGALVAAAAQSGGLLEVKTMQAALESAGVRISQLQMRQLMHKVDCNSDGHFTPHAFLKAMHAVEEPKTPAQSMRVQAFIKHLRAFDRSSCGVLTEQDFVEALNTPSFTIRLFLDQPEVRRLLQYAREHARDPTGGISIDLLERVVGSEKRLPWFLCQRTIRGNVGLLMANKEWDDARTKDQVHRDDAFANPRVPGHVAERRRRVVPPNAVQTLEENTLVSPALLRFSRQDLLNSMAKNF